MRADVILFDHGFGAHHRLLEQGYQARDVTISMNSRKLFAARLF
jgi:hypothetical protein